jgi:hypothetical protein
MLLGLLLLLLVHVLWWMLLSLLLLLLVHVLWWILLVVLVMLDLILMLRLGLGLVQLGLGFLLGGCGCKRCLLLLLRLLQTQQLCLFRLGGADDSGSHGGGSSNISGR